jgi:uncharacterized membrane protein
MPGLLVVHWLHVAAAMTWGGVILVVTFILWPLLLRRPAPEARRDYQSLVAAVGPVMGLSGMTLILVGVLRGTLYGQIRSIADLDTRYGHEFLGAMLGMAVLMAWSGYRRGRLEQNVWTGDTWAPGAARYVHVTNGVTVALLACMVFLMVRMRFGM